MVSVHEKNELGKKCRSFFFLIEILQIGILGAIQDDSAFNPLGQDICQFCLSTAQQSINGNMPERNFLIAGHIFFA